HQRCEGRRSKSRRRVAGARNWGWIRSRWLCWKWSRLGRRCWVRRRHGTRVRKRPRHWWRQPEQLSAVDDRDVHSANADSGQGTRFPSGGGVRRRRERESIGLAFHPHERRRIQQEARRGVEADQIPSGDEARRDADQNEGAGDLRLLKAHWVMRDG